MEITQQDKYTIFSKTRVGFEFEFFTDVKATTVISILKKALGKDIQHGSPKKSVDKNTFQFKSERKVNEEIFRLERDFSGGPMMYELITGPLSYYEAKKVLQVVLAELYKIGWVNDLASLHINISFDGIDLRFLNVLKFCLNFQDIEKRIFKDFPSRKGNIYTESITQILPDYSSLTYDPVDLSIHNAEVKLPNDSKYFGVNFQKLRKENPYLEFRYIGGRNYLTENKKIDKYLEEFVMFFYNQVTNTTITEQDERMFADIVKKKANIMKAFKDIETFNKYFKDIELSVDLNYSEMYVGHRFDELKPILYNLIVNNNMREGFINYDTDIVKLQVKDAVLERGVGVENIDFVSCNIKGSYDNCNFYSCVIKDSMLFDCLLAYTSEIFDSKISNCPSEQDVRFKNCFVRNDKQTYLGIFEQCVIIGSERLMHPYSTWTKDCLFVSEEYASKKGYIGKKIKK